VVLAPDQRGFTLRRETDRSDTDVLPLCQALSHRRAHARPDLLGVLLYPTRLEIAFAQRCRCLGNNTSALVDENTFGSAGPLIDGKYVIHGNAALRLQWARRSSPAFLAMFAGVKPK